MDNLEAYYKQMQGEYPSTIDIREHLPTLREYASKCEHVTEMGFRLGTSFTAFLAAQPKKLITYDIRIPSQAIQFFESIKVNTLIEFNEKSTLDVEIEETDLLFIDTIHTFEQLNAELIKHGNKARKYIIMHDTETYGYEGENGEWPGLNRAIALFLDANPHWFEKAVFKNNNGLTVLERK